MPRVGDLPINIQIELQCRDLGLPLPEAEVRFHATRKWRIDWLWRSAMVGLEVDGGVFIGGRHTRGKGWEADAEKSAEAALAGIVLFHASPRMVSDGTALGWIARAIKQRMPPA